MPLRRLRANCMPSHLVGGNHWNASFYFESCYYFCYVPFVNGILNFSVCFPHEVQSSLDKHLSTKSLFLSSFSLFSLHPSEKDTFRIMLYKPSGPHLLVFCGATLGQLTMSNVSMMLSVSPSEETQMLDNLTMMPHGWDLCWFRMPNFTVGRCQEEACA